MLYHNIIRRPFDCTKFISLLPELEEHECYYLSLQARKKYGAPRDKVLFSFQCHKNNMYQKILRLCSPIGSYTIDDMQLGDEQIALYISVNPRDKVEAATKTAKNIIDELYSGTYNINAHAIALADIHRSCSYRQCVHFDIDTTTLTDEEMIDFCLRQAGAGNFMIVKTRGGYHILVDSREAADFCPNWYHNLTCQFRDSVDQTGDLMLPFPGCNQGGFVPSIIYSPFG